MKAKYPYLAQQLRRELRRMQQEGVSRLPSEAELCRRYECSRQTVRKALELLESEALIEKRQGSGSYLSGGKRLRKIAVVTASDDSYIYPRLLDDIGGELGAAGYETVTYATRRSYAREREILRTLLREQPAGIILERVNSALPSPNRDLIEKLQAGGVCLVHLFAPWDDGSICVGSDDFGGGYLLSRRLIELGHGRLAAIFKSDDMQGIERYRGFCAALRDGNLPISEENILWYSTQDIPYIDSGAIMEYFLATRLGEARGVVCYNDEIALALERTLQKHHRAVSEEVAVVSFDNSYLCDIAPVAITSARHERHALGRTAARVMQARLEGKNTRSVLLPWTLTRRRSG